MDDVLATLPSAQLVRMDTSTTTCTLPAVNFADRCSGLCLARDFWAMGHGLAACLEASLPEYESHFQCSVIRVGFKPYHFKKALTVVKLIR